MVKNVDDLLIAVPSHWIVEAVGTPESSKQDVPLQLGVLNEAIGGNGLHSNNWSIEPTFIERTGCNIDASVCFGFDK